MREDSPVVRVWSCRPTAACSFQVCPCFPTLCTHPPMGVEGDMWPPTHLCLAFTTCCCLCEGALAPCHVPAAPPPPPAVASQVAALAGGVDVLVAGPGRAAKLAASGHLNLNATRALVLDEVDVLCGGWLGMGKSARGKSARGKSAWEGCMGRVHGRGESAWWKSAWCAENAGCVCAGRWGAGPVVGSWGLVGDQERGICGQVLGPCVC